MALVVLVVGQKQQNINNLVVVMNSGNQPVVVCDVENGHRASALNFDLIGRRQHATQLDEMGELALKHEFSPMSQRAGNGRMNFGIFAQTLDGNKPHSK